MRTISLPLAFFALLLSAGADAKKRNGFCAASAFVTIHDNETFKEVDKGTHRNWIFVTQPQFMPATLKLVVVSVGEYPLKSHVSSPGFTHQGQVFERLTEGEAIGYRTNLPGGAKFFVFSTGFKGSAKDRKIFKRIDFNAPSNGCTTAAA